MIWACARKSLPGWCQCVDFGAYSCHCPDGYAVYHGSQLCFEGTEMLGSIAKLLFFLILWFVVGIYLIPVLLKKCRKLMSEETLLIVSLGLCFGMVVLAAHTGFSAAFGAFIMGSILAETVEAESIERLVKPVKDLAPYSLYL